MNQNTNVEDIKARINKNYEMPYNLNRLHGSSNCCLENIAFSIGISQDNLMDVELSAFYESYLSKLATKDGIMNSDFVYSMVLNEMLYMGRKLNRRDEVIVKAFQERLNRVYRFTLSGEPIFYDEEERKQIKAVPAVWKDLGIVRYEHTNPYLRLPIVYDLLGFTVMYGTSREIDDKIDGIMDYIFSTHYQEEVNHGYGIGINGERGFIKSPFYAVGWDICVSHLAPRQELIYMILFSSVTSAKKSQWYMENLQKYKKAVETGDTTFLSQITSANRKTYWTSGCYLNLGRNRDSKIHSITELINGL